MRLIPEDGAEFIGSIKKTGPEQYLASYEIVLDLGHSVLTEPDLRMVKSEKEAVGWLGHNAAARGFKGFYLRDC